MNVHFINVQSPEANMQILFPRCISSSKDSKELQINAATKWSMIELHPFAILYMISDDHFGE